ncbi:hypothetical protein N9L02_02495 [Gammaproteobacteria bacterium]|nr:hypothetical protein [Gammaproteobacteria bacterium]
MNIIENKTEGDDYNFSVKEIIKQAWKNTYGVKLTMWTSMIIYTILSILILLVGYVAISYFETGIITTEIINYSPETETFKSQLEWIRWLILFPMHTGILLLAVKKSENQIVKIKQVFKPYKFYLPILIVGISLFLFISLSKFILQLSYEHIPNFIIIFTILDIFITLFCTIWLTFAGLLIIEKNKTVFKAILLSLSKLKQHFLKVTLTLAFFVMPYFIISNIIIFAPSFIILGENPISSILLITWCILITLIILSAIWVIPTFLNLGGILFKIIFKEKTQNHR